MTNHSLDHFRFHAPRIQTIVTAEINNCANFVQILSGSARGTFKRVLFEVFECQIYFLGNIYLALNVTKSRISNIFESKYALSSKTIYFRVKMSDLDSIFEANKNFRLENNFHIKSEC